MPVFRSALCALLVLLCANCFANKIINISSPDVRIKFTISTDQAGLFYEVSYKNTVMVDKSRLNISFKEGGSFNHDLFISPVKMEHLTEDYQLITGKTSKVHSDCNSVVIPVSELSGTKRNLNIEVRVFNDGAAFRYVIPKQGDLAMVNVTDEINTFNLTQNPQVTALLRMNYTTSHEGIYTKVKLKDLKADTLMDMPALFEFPNGNYMAITEAALLDYAGMYLIKHNGLLESRLSPLPKQPDIKVKAILPHSSPWRVIMISDRVGAFIESNILTSLSPPCRVKDVSWIKPGKTTFPWWNGNAIPDTSFAPGNNYDTQMYYVNWCAKYGIEYHSVVEYGLHEWYVNDGAGFQPGPNADPTRAVPGLDMQQVCDSAAKRGVGIRFWVHWAALYLKLDAAFTQYEKWGVKGLMCDFMDRDDQEMVNMQTEILEKAAQHKLHIQFHGAYKPTGLSRTYPNEFTREGTLNYENDKWNDIVTPDADINIPFTRMLAGSTDYHLGGFHAANAKTFKVHYTRPYVLGTRCHMMAMYVVLENTLGMVCDAPDDYIGQPGFEFLQQVPTTWDETKVLSAKVGKYVAIARRKGTDWYIGAITDHDAQNLPVKLDFLAAGNYKAEVYSDAGDVEQYPDHLIKEINEVNNATMLNIQLSSGGGQVIHISLKQ
ncbi:glycoside hydrolase family 97 protein [Mucilaginibacter flavus]|uniref:glycoside hydrolase family 97 protein n=1 Tax=Mucilaginibacter flavus TaxID=931504 RepID=UPI0025B3EF5B|nr:glycoside hydrolase family 97 protein [Mucilaginibacter flavus]MDN3583238.1 glycoside hydrolase family 97 protein [Mucilaginibacter flavus]